MSDDRAQMLRRRVAALSDAQRQGLADLLAREAGAGGAERLVAFVVATDGAALPDDTLRAFLAERLPDYMIPARFVTLDGLPRTAAGKLDRRALAHARVTQVTAAPTDREPTAPRTEIEAKLAAIWKDVLKVDDVGVNDDFFELGGDSLLSIRVIGRAGREGIRISPERFFERPTIAHMAASVAGTAPHDSRNGSRAVTESAVGDAPLTPIQHWFLDAIPHHRDWWNQSYLLECGHRLDPESLQRIIAALVRHHDALRLTLTNSDGRWRQRFGVPDEDVPVRVVDMDGLPADRYGACVVEEGEREHAALRIADGRLFRCVLFLGADGWQRILLLGHHLVVDGVSWNIILDDFATLVTQAVAGEPLRLPERTAPARARALALEAAAATPAVAASAAHWVAMPVGDDAVPADPPAEHRATSGGRANLNRDATVASVSLGAGEARALLLDASRRLDVSVQSLLLGALLIAWQRWTGRDALRLDVEGHGRDVLGDALNVSRTVGWFTTVFPVRLALPSAAGGGGDTTAGRIARDVQTTLDALPMRGAAHGLARYLAPDESVRAALAAQPRPAILFNHLGAHDLALAPASRVRVTDESHGRSRSPESPRAYMLELNTRVEGGALIVAIEYSDRMHTVESIEAFAGHYRDALGVMSRGAPADAAPFALAGLDALALATVADLLSELDDA